MVEIQLSRTTTFNLVFLKIFSFQDIHKTKSVCLSGKHCMYVHTSLI